ncbi:MAG: hypothetical protein ACR2Q4_08960, partial [Geminicoccaceae bacterium]
QDLPGGNLDLGSTPALADDLRQDLEEELGNNPLGSGDAAGDDSTVRVRPELGVEPGIGVESIEEAPIGVE